MRKIRYAVSTSLDGYIAGPKGESDWVVFDPEIVLEAGLSQFDTVLIGRRTYQSMVRSGATNIPGLKVIVLSTTLRQENYPDVTILGGEYQATLKKLKESDGKDIWVLGGSSLFRSLLDSDLVDTVEVNIIPILLGDGLLFLPPPSAKK